MFDEVTVNFKKNSVKIVVCPCLCKHNCSEFLVNTKYNQCGASLTILVRQVTRWCLINHSINHSFKQWISWAVPELMLKFYTEWTSLPLLRGIDVVKCLFCCILKVISCEILLKFSFDLNRKIDYPTFMKRGLSWNK